MKGSITIGFHPMKVKTKIPDSKKFLELDNKVSNLLGIYTTDGSLSYRPNVSKSSMFITGDNAEMGELNKTDVSYVIEIYEHKSFDRSDVIYIGDLPSSESQMHDAVYKNTNAKIVLYFHEDKHSGKIKCPKVGYIPLGTKELADNVARAIKRYKYNRKDKHATPKILELINNGFLIMGKNWNDIKSTYIKYFK